MRSALLLYYLLCIVYLLIQFRKSRKHFIIQAAILPFCPFIGFVMIYYMYKNKQKQNQKLSEEFIKIEKGEADFLQRVDIEKETNIVPMKDALLLNDNQTKRKMLLDMLKNDTFIHMGILQSALENDDTETSHYAATAIQDIKSKLLNAIQSLEYETEKQPDNVKLLISYAQVIKEYINTGFIDERTKRQYYYQFSHILERIIEKEPQEKSFYLEKINCDFQLREMEHAETDCQNFLQQFPDDEDAYFMTMKLYYLLSDQMNFNHALEKLRQSSVRLTPQGLNKIRFWLTGDPNGQ
ncbi:hypothetical protein [Bacillus rubiinfantis]|uniref:hypothetical protein n=1 Tax=Bacillus rubiinfantis TaxID=1499680 RepID=UPI0005A7440C|nr:hypothetical protein [Bacillus rubiinfantis]